MSRHKRGGPLEGVRVLELTKVWAGPYAGKQLAFLGAEVIRIESKGSLDVTRTYGVDDIDKAPGFQAVNPQKLSAQIDMKSKEGLALLKDLASKCDILIENMRPGAIDRLGLGYEAVRAANPRIVFVSMGMYGADGPLAYQTGYAPCFVALAGLSALVGFAGEAPSGMNMRYADSTFGTAAAYAAVVALKHRQASGEGQYIDVSAVETMSSMIGDSLFDYGLTGRVAVADGNRHPDMAPHGLFPAEEGDWLALAVTSDAAWAALAEAMGIAADPRFATLAGRKADEDELETLVADWTRGKDARELAADLQARGIAAAKSLNSVDLIGEEHLWMRGFYRDAVDRAGESKPILGPGFTLSHPAALTDAAPALGQDNAYVFGEIMGLSDDEQTRLRDAGITR